MSEQIQTGGGVAGGGVTGGGVTGGGVTGGGVTVGGVAGGGVTGGGVAGGGVVAHLQCPFCGLFSNSHSHQLIHVAAMHPGKLEGFSVGRLGNILIYQRTAKLFHCGECFHTCRDFSKLYQHLVTKHCLDQEQEEQEAQGERGEREGEIKEEVKEEVKEEEEEEDGEEKGEKEEGKESSSLLAERGGRGGHRCLICGWRTKHRGLAISHVVRKHDIPKAYASQGVKYAAPPLRGEEGEFMREELMKEEIEATNKVVGLISNRYVCLLCGWKSKRKGFAINHVVRSHDVKRPYSCRSCDRSFFLPSRLQQHVSSSHRLGRFRCPFCCFRSQFLGGFRRHCSRCNAREEEEEGEEGGEEEERRKRSREEELEEEEQDERRGTRKRRKTLKVQEREEEEEEEEGRKRWAVKEEEEEEEED